MTTWKRYFMDRRLYDDCALEESPEWERWLQRLGEAMDSFKIPAPHHLARMTKTHREDARERHQKALLEEHMIEKEEGEIR